MEVGEQRESTSTHRLATILLIAYVAVSLLALFAIPASLYGWFGAESDPLSGIFALLLALPWSLLLNLFDDVGTWGAFAICAAGITLNVAIAVHLLRRRGH